MAVAYVDTSWLLGIAFGETGATRLAAQLDSFTQLVSANLLEAEFRSAHHRGGRGRTEGTSLLPRIRWIYPERRLDREIGRVLEAGHLRAAACWHLAVALYFTEKPEDLTFLTLDEPQGRIARALGFRTEGRG